MREMFRPDLVLTKAGRPMATVEAKARPLSGAFETAALRQLQVFSSEVGSPWALLVDPKEMRIYNKEKRVARLSTEEILRDVFPVAPKVVGEQTLLVAVNRWLGGLSRRRDFLTRHPELGEFVRDVEDAVASLVVVA